MRSLAPKQSESESEFDDLLGQLVDELAMTPASESAVQLVPDPPAAEARVDSTNHMAAEAAAAAQARSAAPTSNNMVKIVGIVAGSLTAVAVAALLVFGMQDADSGEQAADASSAVDQAELDRLAEAARAEQAAVEQAQAAAIAAEQSRLEARAVRLEAAELADDLAAAKAAAAKKPKPRRRSRPKPKPKPKPTPGDSFEDL